MDKRMCKIINPRSHFKGMAGVVEYLTHNDGYPLVKVSFEFQGLLPEFFFLEEVKFL